MLLILTWLSIHALLLLSLGLTVRRLRTKSAFKLLFLPGTLVAVALQAMAARLSMASRCQISILGGGKPAFEFQASEKDPKAKMPPLSGALFVLLSHGTLYVLFLLGALELESRGLLEAHAASLPAIYPERLLDLHLELDLAGYASGLALLGASARQHPLAAAGLLYLFAGTLASMRFLRRETIWGLVLLALLTAIRWIAHFFGADFPMFSRGWWAGFSFFPRAWALFSLYVTGTWLSLALFLSPALPSFIRRAVHTLRHGGGEKGKSEGGKGKSPARKEARSTVNA